MKKIRVLLVDDSAVIRKVLSDAISEDAELEVIGSAANGRLALDQLEALKPDIVTLDIEMPELDGLQTVQEIRKRGNQVPIIMCSSLTAHGATHTLDALTFGANDYVTKPSSHGINTREVVGAELIRKIKGLVSDAQSASPQLKRAVSVVESNPHGFVPSAAGINQPGVIAIGVSTGGPNALQEIIPKLPPDLSVPILVVQHMPPLFTKLLAERLYAQSQMPVLEAVEGQDITPGHIYIAPGGFHMEVKRVLGRTYITLNEEAPENSCRPAVDRLLRSVARVYGASALAIILTGMGQDGLLGCQDIKSAGGTIIAQDRHDCAVWGMPGAVIQAGLASASLSLPEIAVEISKNNKSKSGSFTDENRHINR